MSVGKKAENCPGARARGPFVFAPIIEREERKRHLPVCLSFGMNCSDDSSRRSISESLLSIDSLLSVSWLAEIEQARNNGHKHKTKKKKNEISLSALCVRTPTATDQRHCFVCVDDANKLNFFRTHRKIS